MLDKHHLFPKCFVVCVCSERMFVVFRVDCASTSISARAAAPTPNLRELYTDAERAEHFLSHMRALYAPHREDFRKMVLGINDSAAPTAREEAAGLKVFDARPKYVLRKLAFSMLPTNSK